jgi:hypothetical protein
LYIETQELRQWLAMWRELKQLYDTEQYDEAVARFGAIFVVHNNAAHVSREIPRLETLIATRRE